MSLVCTPRAVLLPFRLYFMASQQPTYMKAKLATGMIFIFLFQIMSVLPEVDRLSDFQTESKSQISSPQGVSDTIFVSMTAESLNYRDFFGGDSREFGGSLLAMNYDNSDPIFGGS